MSRPIVAVRLIVAVIVVMGAAGCRGTAASPTGIVGASSAASAATATAITAAPTATPDPPSPSIDEPPAASLAAEGGDPVTGSLGSYTWRDGGSDSPWLPGAPITVGSGEQLTVTLAGDDPVTGWVAKRVAAGTADVVGAVPIAEGATHPITFTAPGPGRWSVQVVVTFGDGLGSAAYYWDVTVR